MDRVLPWLIRAAWALLPLVAGPALSDALAPTSAAVRATASVGLWAAWATALVATLVAHPISLTALRLAAPAALAASAWAAGTGRPGTVAAVEAVVHAGVVLLLVLAPGTALWAVNGPAYPNERRFPLRIPGALAVGPALVAGLLTVALPVAAALLLAARAWVPGAAAAVLGIPLAAGLARAVHGLARRWLVFVPAGLVIHDPLALADPVLFPKAMIARFGPAPADTDATDLTLRAPGLALELRMKEPATIVRTRPRRAAIDSEQVDAVLVTPARPGAVMLEAERRAFAIG